MWGSCNNLVLVAVVLMACVHLSYGLEAVLCYTRERELECGMQIPLKKDALLNMGSVTFSLSTDAEKLAVENRDGRSCNEVRTDCTVNIRESTVDKSPAPLKIIYETIKQQCVNQTKCSLSMPDWSDISIESHPPACEATEDGSVYHFKQAYIHMPCYFPRPTTPAPTTTPAEVEEGDVEFTNETVTEPPLMVEEDMETSDNSTDQEDDITEKPDEMEKEEEKVQEPPAVVGPKNPPPQQGGNSANGLLYKSGYTSIISTVILVLTTALLVKH